MKVVMLSFCIIAACVLVLVPVMPSVESAAIYNMKKADIQVQSKTITQNLIREKLQQYDIHKNHLPPVKQLVTIFRSDFGIVLPGILIFLLFYAGAFLQSIGIGGILTFLGAYLEFFAVILIEIIHAIGWEIYWPYPFLVKNI